MNTEPTDENGVAIVGMAARFPKAGNIDQFWRNLSDGVEGITFFTDEELAEAGVEGFKDSPNYVKARAVLEGADLFDADFFSFNPREAELLDPQHRVFLECAWEALEDAGCDPARFDGAIGVFAGMSMNTYLAQNVLTHPELLAQFNEHQLMLASDKDFLPTRVSYKLNLRGPSLNIQTACSTSLVAVSVACQNLLNHECDLALAGAVSITFPQKRGYLFQEGGIASPDGHCRAFDAKAAGTVPGQGAGIVVLKRLVDALAEGDIIYAVIKGFAINNDGSNKIGYTAPGVEGQAEVIATAQAMAGFAPETINYLEAHGTGTPLGDPIEIEALTRAFHAGSAPKKSCAIGSVKSNIGHLDTAAGVAGLIKTALALHHKRLPPSLHFESPNPKIDFASSPFHVNQRPAEWRRGETPRRAGVSSFGIGGTNAHVVLEEAPAWETSSESRPAQLLLISAKTETALGKATSKLAAHLKQNPALNLADVAYTLQTGRQEFRHRRMLVCREPGEAANALETPHAKRVFSRVSGQENPPIAFMFPGQGAQHVNMGLELYEREPVFREQVNTGCEILRPHLGFDLRTVLYPTAGKAEKAQEQIAQTAVAQPALFTVEYALAQLWMSWGVRPEAMIGHSVGEYVAACLAGVFSVEDALNLVAARARMMQQLPGGRMLAVRLPENDVVSLLNEQISLAAVNAPSLCVVSGPVDAIEILERDLSRRGVACMALQTSHAFHSAMVEPILKPFVELVSRVKLDAPRIPYISNITGGWVGPVQATDPNYWAKHLRQTVRFADGTAELFKEPARVLLEAGPGQTLSNLAKQHPARNVHSISVSSLRHAKESRPDWEILLNALGQLWLSGVMVDWKVFCKYEKRRRVRLPAYPFEHKRFWIEPAKPSQVRMDLAAVETVKRESEKTEAVPIRVPSGPETMTGEDQTVIVLRKILGELSGLDLAAMGGGTTFTEMGFDSLFLTQASVVIEREFGVRIAFRQLLEELSTLDALAAHIRQSLPAEAEKPIAANGNVMAANIHHKPEELVTIPLTETGREHWFAPQIIRGD
jgi:phthiocerol/phenolphthiocerol synthesis type-I polyketide synthase E